MALASLTIELTLGLATFTSDSGKVAQVFLRNSESMSAAARAVARDIEKQSAALAGGAANTLALKAAAAGLSEQFKPAIESLKRVEAASAAAKGETLAMFGQSAAAASAYYSKLDALTAKSAAEISAVRAAQRQFDAEIRARSEGGVSDADKKLLAASKSGSEQRIQQLQREFNEQAALIRQDAVAAAAAEASAAKQVAAAQRIIDANRGVSASYRQEAAEILALRRARALSQDDARAAFDSLNARQPAARAKAALQAEAQREADAAALVQKRIADAAAEAAAKQVADAKRIIDANNGVSASYRKQLDEILALRRAGALDRTQARTAVDRLNADQPAERTKQAFLNDLNRLAAGINDDGTQKARSALLALQAAQLGVGKEAEAALKKLTALDEKTGQFGKSAFGARNRLLTLQYTISDVIASAGSGISPLTILLQQGGQIFDAFGGANAREGTGFFKNFFSTIGQILTPARLAIGGVVGAAVGLAFAYKAAAKEGDDFARAIITSGNAAGVTTGQLQSIAASVDAVVGTQGQAAEVLAKFAQGGQVAAQNLEQFTTIALQLDRLDAAPIEDTVKAFEDLGRAPLDAVKRLNVSHNFLTLAVYEQVRALQEQGRTTEAAAVAQKAFFDAQSSRIPQLTAQLGPFQQAWKGLKDIIRETGDELVNAFRPETLDGQRAAIQKQIDQLQRAGQERPVFGGASQTELRAQLDGLNRTEDANRKAAASERERAQLVREGQTAVDSASATNRRYETTQQRVTRELKAYREELGRIKAANPNSELLDPETIKRTEAGIRSQGSGGRTKIDREPEQIRREQLAADIKALQDAYANERETIAFHNRQVAALYQAGNVSLKQFNDAKIKEIEQGTQREVDALLKIVARQRAALEDPLVQKNPSEQIKIKGEIAETLNQITKVVVDGERKVQLANIETGVSYKQLADQVANYRAELLQLQGDEAGAASIRAKRAIEAARELAKRSEKAPNAADRVTQDEIDRKERALSNEIALQEAVKKTGQINAALALSEDRIALLREKGSIGELDALALQGQARQKVVAALEAQLAAMQKVYDESGAKNPQLLLDIERTRLEIDKLTASLDPLKEKFDNLLKGAGEGFFETLMGGKGIKAALKSFSDQVFGELNRVVAKELSRQVFGEGGILGGAGGFLAGAFGGKGGGESAAQTAATAAITAAQASSAAAIATANATAEAATATAIVTAITASTTAIVSAIGASAATGSAGGFLNDLGGLEALGSLGFARGGVFGAQPFASGGIFNSPTFFRFADGGTVNRLGVMGEAGPEAVMPLRRGPDGKLGVAAGGGRDGGTRVINFSPTFVFSGPVSKQTPEQVEAAAFRGMQRAASRGTAGVR